MFCWLFRITISLACDGDKSLWQVTQRHLTKCLHCREFHNFCLSLDEKLPKDMEGLIQHVPDSPHERILNNIKNTTKTTYRKEIAAWPIAIAAVLAMIIIIGGIYYYQMHQESKITMKQEVVSSTDIINDIDELSAAGLQWAMAYKKLEDPIKLELQNIVNDTKSASRFLFACVDVDITDRDEFEDSK